MTEAEKKKDEKNRQLLQKLLTGKNNLGQQTKKVSLKSSIN